ncbi:MAG: hypothetical protein KIS81_00810 [Maricaulaceae bacterium]|nr:hypothetical protein [Maricaulaceae bacterium]
MGALAISDLAPMAGEPRVQDIRLGEVLGYSRPTFIRTTINRNRDEILMHGPLLQSEAMVEIGSGAVRETQSYWLNEAQALLVCMFARTEKAAQVRSQVISVFMAWRRGELVEAAHAPDPAALAMARLESRIAALEALGQRLEALMENPLPAARALTHSEAVFGHLRLQRRPAWWHDAEVRGAILSRHRQMTLDRCRAEIATAFGESRAPSRSSIHRFWKALDLLKAQTPSREAH